MGTKRVNVRPMKEDDLSRVVELDRLVSLRPWTYAMFSEELRLGSHCRVVEDEYGVIVGFLVARLLWDEWHLLSVGIAPVKRRSGLARKLVRELIVRAGQTASKAVILEVRVGNVSAIGLYGSLGFVSIGVRKNYYQDLHQPQDAVVMERLVCPGDELNPF